MSIVDANNNVFGSFVLLINSGFISELLWHSKQPQWLCEIHLNHQNKLWTQKWWTFTLRKVQPVPTYPSWVCLLNVSSTFYYAFSHKSAVLSAVCHIWPYLNQFPRFYSRFITENALKKNIVKFHLQHNDSWHNKTPLHCETLYSCLQSIYKKSLVMIGIMCITFKVMPVLWVKSQVCALHLRWSGWCHSVHI